eukprot:gnl/MRDRNA2_/MRDRNA2_15807_c0_seq1.p1 gnl/MRDRNA2_/MRDRNA2_15807_c0~~gnl/MRDRNA2_/MRDRNA2_15807_c0_seq1.p1  ORF type:complete len:228 (+),score=50.64 gnl/MRDRNA2_/MRDRNA2_15807_c0_seq1:125-808(+)
MMEKRIDPEDGYAYTFDELAQFYKGKYKKQHVLKYWDNDCTPLRGKKGKAKAKAEEAPAPAAEEKRIDPAYGEAYTLNEILAFYKGKFNKKACIAYWEDECKPVKRNKGAANAKVASANAEALQEEKRIDPRIGEAYTFKELLPFYKKACKEYWEKTCKPVNSKLGIVSFKGVDAWISKEASSWQVMLGISRDLGGPFGCGPGIHEVAKKSGTGAKRRVLLMPTVIS